jgi:hypothetical protein
LINFTVRDGLNKLIPSKHCVREIMAANEDKIFLYAKNIDNGIESSVYLDSDNCIVALNDKIVNSIKDILSKYDLSADLISDIFFVEDIRQGRVEGFLFSAGVIAKNPIGEPLMIERDAGAPTEPMCWQFPAGRCEEIKSLNVAKNEIDEEVKAFNSFGKVLISQSIVENSDQYKNVNYFVDNELVHVSNSIAILDEKNNTLEQYYFAEVPFGYEFKDEEFNRKIDFIAPEKISTNDLPMVSLIEDKRHLLVDMFLTKEKDSEIELSN